MSDTDGKAQDNTFDFVVKTKTSKTLDIGYNLVIEKLEPSSGYSFLNDEDINIYLTDSNNNELVFKNIGDINKDYVLYTKTNNHNSTNKEIKDKYKLRVWVDKNVLTNDWNENTKLEYKFKIGVKTSVKETDTEESYIVKYNANKGTGNIEDSTFKQGESKKLNKNTFTREGYTFKGWSTSSKSKEVVYKDEAEVKNLTNVYNGIVNLYAVWEGNTYKIRYNSNGGTKPASTVEEVTDIDFDVTYDPMNLNTSETRWTYEDGIYKSAKVAQGTKSYLMKMLTLEETSALSIELAVAHSNALTVGVASPDLETIYFQDTAPGDSTITSEENVKYHKISGVTLPAGTYMVGFIYEGQGFGFDRAYIKNIKATAEVTRTEMKNSSFKVGDKNKLSKNEYTKEGYIFKGWSTTLNGELKYKDEEEIKDLTLEKDEIIDLYAVWEKEKYKVNVVVQNGTLLDGEVPSKEIEYNSNGTFNLYPNTSGYTGTVACTNNQKGTFKDGVLTVSNVTSDTTCTVIYKAITYNVKYNANGGTGSMSNSIHTYDEEKELSKNEFIKTGYTFKGWSTTTSGEIIYKDQNRVKNLTDVDGKIINLYAIWEINKYTVNVVVKDGIVDGDASKIIDYNNNATFNISPTNDKYVLGTVECTNNQKGTFKDGVLTVSNVTNDTTCTVTYMTELTTLYTDGTLIINEQKENREASITKHGEVIKDYEAMSASNSYVFTYSYSNSAVNSPWFAEREQVKSVEIGETIKPISTAYWFRDLENMEKGDFTNLDTSKVTNMRDMFYKAGTSATAFNLDVSNWNTSNVTNMYNMFFYAGTSATTWNIGDLSNWNTSNVKSMRLMFSYAGQNATTWSIGNLSNWDTSQVTDIYAIFNHAGTSATTWNIGDLSGWDTSQVTDMGYMFRNSGYNSTTWNIGDLSNWDTSNVTSMNGMFRCAGYNATTFNLIGLEKWNTSKVIDMNVMFYYTGYNSKTFNLNLSNWNTSNVTDMSSMFSSAGKNATTWNIGDLSNWNTSNVTDMSAMFSYAGKNATTWNIGNLSNWDTSNVKSMSVMFYDAGSNATTWNIGNLSNWDTSNVTNMSFMFDGAGHNATTWNIGDLSLWKTSNVKNMSYMFNGAGHNATTWSIGDLSSWKTSNVTDMCFMFNNAGQNATTWSIGNLSSWDTSSVTDMRQMFSAAGQNATTWSIGDLSSWNTSNVTSMRYMFSSAGQNATTWSIGDLSGWNTSNVTSMESMFNLTGEKATTWSIGDLSSWDTSNVTNMSWMFSFAGEKATTWSIGDLSLWDTSNVKNMSYMFNGAGYSATTWTVKIPSTTGSLTNTTSKWYGSSESVYAEPASGKSFTLS